MAAVPYPDVIRNWGSRPEERIEFPDDDQLLDPDEVLHRAVTVDAPADLLWRWLCQLRVAPYSYDWLDNFGRRSPRQLIAGLDALEVGQRAMTIFRVSGFERHRHVTFALDRHPLFGRVVVTYVVEPLSPTRSRLEVRLRIRYPRNVFASMPMRVILPPGDLIMMRRQLLNLKALAERDGRRN